MKTDSDIETSGSFDVDTIAVSDHEDGFVSEGEVADARDASAYSKKRERMKREVRRGFDGLGLSEEELERRTSKIVALRLAGGGSRDTGASPCDPTTIARYVDQTDDALVMNAVKGIRNDGGSLGVEGRYLALIEQANTSAEAAAKLAQHVQQRIAAIRSGVVGALNESRRRAALANGLDPLRQTYLRTRGAE